MNAAARPKTLAPASHLELSLLLGWLREDKVISPEDAVETARRFSTSHSAQHPITRLASAGMVRFNTTKALDAEVITEWLAKRTGLPYLRIDPLKADVGRVSEVMSITYAERRRALPLNVGATEVTIATCEPLDIGWVAEIEGHTRKTVKLVLVSPLELKRYTTEFYTLSRSVRNATKSGEVSAAASFEQLVELGRTNKQLDANDQGVVQVVDWLWQYAIDQRASDIHLEPRRERSVIRFRIDGVMQTVYQLPPGVMNAMIARVKLLGRMSIGLSLSLLYTSAKLLELGKVLLDELASFQRQLGAVPRLQLTQLGQPLALDALVVCGNGFLVVLVPARPIAAAGAYLVTSTRISLGRTMPSSARAFSVLRRRASPRSLEAVQWTP